MGKLIGSGSAVMTSNVSGVLWMLVAVTALTAMFAIAKHVMHTLPVFEVGMFRFAMSLLFYLPWLFKHGLGALHTKRPLAHFSRGCFGAASLAASIYAVHHMRLADATVLAFTVPLWSILFAALFLREPIRFRRSVATVLGFVGVVVIVQPQTGFSAPALIALMSAVLATGAITTMKSLTRTEPAERIVFYFLLSGFIVLAIPAYFAYQAPSAVDWAWLLTLGFLGSAGQYCMTRAYAAGDMTVIAPFDFTRIIIAGLFGYFVFNEVPDVFAILGTALVIVACLYILRDESQARKP